MVEISWWEWERRKQAGEDLLAWLKRRMRAEKGRRRRDEVAARRRRIRKVWQVAMRRVLDGKGETELPARVRKLISEGSSVAALIGSGADATGGGSAVVGGGGPTRGDSQDEDRAVELDSEDEEIDELKAMLQR